MFKQKPQKAIIFPYIKKIIPFSVFWTSNFLWKAMILGQQQDEFKFEQHRFNEGVNVQFYRDDAIQIGKTTILFSLFLF